MKTKKDKVIKFLNNKVLFNLRKMYGMFGQIHFSVIDIDGNTIVIKITTPHKHLNKSAISKNIRYSAKTYLLPEYKVKVVWMTYKPLA